MNSMTMHNNTNVSFRQGSAEAIAFLAPVWCSALEATVCVALGSVARGGRHIFGCFFAWVCMAVLLLRRHGVAVLEFALLHASLVVCFCALGTVLVDALLGEVIRAAACEDEDTPAVAVRRVMLEGLCCDLDFRIGSVPDRSDLRGKLVVCCAQYVIAPGLQCS